MDMKKYFPLLIFFALNWSGSVVFGQTENPAAKDSIEALGLPGDNLDLYAVLDLFQKSKTIEEFEKTLNLEETKINNLDLNLDGKVDFIKVTTKKDGDDFMFIMQVDVADKETQDVAVILVSKDKDKKVTLQIVGDKELYGKDYIVEPKTQSTPSVTANPAYQGSDPVTVNVPASTTTVIVEQQPIVQYVYSPAYVPYYPPYYYGYYPPYFMAFSVMTFSMYAMHHSYYHHGGYGYHGNTTVIHNTNNFNNYNNNSRRTSNTVNHNNASGNYNRGNNASTRPSTGTSNRPSAGTSNRPSTGTSNRPSTGTSNRPSAGTSNRPSAGTSDKSSSGSSNRSTAGTSNRSTAGTSNRSTAGTSNRSSYGSSNHSSSGYSSGSRSRSSSSSMSRGGGGGYRGGGGGGGRRR
jgi:hypothetical protein